MATSLAACARNDHKQRLRAVTEARAERAAARRLPPLPADCRTPAHAGVREGDRLDVAVLKLDDALTQQIARTERCADWYDQLRAGMRAAEDGI